MPQARCSDQEFISMFQQHGLHETTRRLQTNHKAVAKRRRRMEQKYHIKIDSPNAHPVNAIRDQIEPHPQRVKLNIVNGIVLVGSDSHYWPDYVTTAHRAFVEFCKEHKPYAIIKNGDELDGATISRFPAQNWDQRPTLKEEFDTVKDRLSEIEQASRNSKMIWSLGNHDARYEMRLANHVPEVAKIEGTRLKDHFPRWMPCWSVWINDDVVIKHRWRGGIHATRNNTLHAGLTMITGHLHSLRVSPYSDYTGTRWGVDTGCLADPYGPQFEYLEDSPRDWRSGFVMLTFKGGKLLWPEVINVRADIASNVVEFRGQIYHV